MVFFLIVGSGKGRGSFCREIVWFGESLCGCFFGWFLFILCLE